MSKLQTMEEITGTLERLDTRLDWLVKFSLATAERGTVWLGAKTKEHPSLLVALREHDRLPQGSRPTWHVEFYEEPSRGKDGTEYTNRWITSAREIAAAPANSPANGQSITVMSKEAQIARAVAFKGVIDLLVAAKSQVELTGGLARKAVAIDTVGELMQVGPIVNTLTNQFEAILNRSYRADEQATIEQSDDDGFEEI